MNPLKSKESHAIEGATHLYPGEIVVGRSPQKFSTVLGSCVAVCIIDQNRRFGGMNHIMLPTLRKTETPTTRYASVATYILVEELVQTGASRRWMQAKVFGGANQSGEQSEFKVGKRNLEITLDVLNKLNIPVVSFDTGGYKGRKIMFDLLTGKVFLKYLENYDFDSEAELVQKPSINISLK